MPQNVSVRVANLLITLAAAITSSEFIIEINTPFNFVYKYFSTENACLSWSITSANIQQQLLQEYYMITQ
jgi:hypothetical protein